jgi:hypothetical protein
MPSTLKQYFSILQWPRQVRLAKMRAGKEIEGKRSADMVLDEGGRRPWHTSHIADPKPPTVVFGEHPLEVRKRLDIAIETYHASIDMKKLEIKRDLKEARMMRRRIERQEFSPKTEKLLRKLQKTEAEIKAMQRRVRRLRKDQMVLMTVVTSYPIPRVLVESSNELMNDYLIWRGQSTAFMESEFPQHLKSVVEHQDERYLHLHGYCVPNFAAKECTLDLVHPGRKAVSKAVPKEIRDDTSRKRRRDAWVSGMRALQLRFFLTVSWRHGHSLKGARSMRLTRSQLKSQQQQRESIAAAIERAKYLISSAQRERDLATRARAEAERARDQARGALDELTALRREAAKFISWAKAAGVALPTGTEATMQSIDSMIAPEHLSESGGI